MVYSDELRSIIIFGVSEYNIPDDGYLVPLLRLWYSRRGNAAIPSRSTAIQFSIVHTLSGYYILIIARFVRGCAVFERVLARRALGAIL